MKQKKQSKIIAIILLLVSFNLIAQNNDQKSKLNINLENATLVEIFEKIKEQSDYKFNYGELILNNKKKFKANFTNKTITEILNKLKQDGNFDYKITNNIVSIYPSKGQSQDKPTSNNIQNNFIIKGVVKDEKGESLMGATIIEAETKNGTFTDMNGNFELILQNSNSIIQVSYIGFQTQEININNQTNFDISLSYNNQALNEVVVIGYGTQNKSTVTGAVSKIATENIENQTITSFDEGLSGQMAGVSVSQNSGAPGTTSEINIRGVGTLTAGRNPLLVIDGFPSSESTDLTSINPTTIESIEILKDAAAAAIYGSRGSNGVILITTKKGSKNKTEFTFNSYHGFQEVTKKIKVANAYQRAQLIATARNNSWLDLDPSNSVNDPNSVRPSDLKIPTYLYPYLEGESGLIDTDWQDEIYRVAPIKNYELSVSGGNENTTYFVSGNFHKRDGIVINSDYSRFSLTSNLNTKLSDKVELGVNLTPSMLISNEINEGDHKDDGIIFTALLANPMYAPRDANGDLIISEMIEQADENGFAPTENPVALALLTSSRKKATQLLGSTYLKWELAKKIFLKTQLGGQTLSSREDVFRPSILGSYATQAPTLASAQSETDNFYNYLWENTLNYDFDIMEKHLINVLLGHSFQSEMIEGNKITASNFPNDAVETLNAGIVNSGNSYRERWSLLSYLGRINYSFKDKYLISAAIRGDASSRFGKNNKWGYFPSVSAGWNVAKENFFKSDYISLLKLRASYGKTGNNQISNYGSIALLGNSNYVLDNQLVTGQSITTAPNDNLSWERTDMYNTAIDLQIKNGKYFATLEYYVSDTKDLLLDTPVPAHSGYTNSLQNIGEVRNSGLEFTVGANIKSKNFKWKSNFNIATNKNEVIKLGPRQNRILGTVHLTEVGKPLGSFYGYNVLGVYQTEEEIANSASLPTSQVGSYKYEDINGDGEISDADRKIIGDFFPDFTYGFSNSFKYKNLDLNILIEGKQGFEVFYGLGFFHYNSEGWNNVSTDLINNYFTPDNPNATYARPLASPTDKRYEYSNLMIKDGSYVRLKSINLGYTLPKSLSKLVRFESFRIYATAQNLLTLTKYPGYNPEVTSKNKSWNNQTLTRGVDYGAYPLAKSVVFGIQAKF